MTQALYPKTKPVKLDLPGLPRAPLSPQQQLEALQRIQSQAEQRVKLGVQLFKAAEAQTAQHRQLIDEVRTEQKKFREQVEEDITRSLHAYDQWVGEIDASLADSVSNLEARIEKLEHQWTDQQQRVEGMVLRAERLLTQVRDLLMAGRLVPAPALKQVAAATLPVDEAAPAAEPVAHVEPQAIRPSPRVEPLETRDPLAAGIAVVEPDEADEAEARDGELESAQEPQPESAAIVADKGVAPAAPDEPPHVLLPQNFYTDLIRRLDRVAPPPAKAPADLPPEEVAFKVDCDEEEPIPALADAAASPAPASARELPETPAAESAADPLAAHPDELAALDAFDTRLAFADEPGLEGGSLDLTLKDSLEIQESPTRPSSAADRRRIEPDAAA